MSPKQSVLKTRFHCAYWVWWKPPDGIQTCVYFEDLLDCVVAVAPRNDGLACVFIFSNKAETFKGVLFFLSMREASVFSSLRVREPEAIQLSRPVVVTFYVVQCISWRDQVQSFSVMREASVFLVIARDVSPKQSSFPVLLLWRLLCHCECVSTKQSSS